MLKILKWWKNVAYKAGLGLCVVLFVTALIGGLLFNIEPSTVFSWFTTVFVIIFGGMFAVALLGFLLWYFFTKPWVTVPIVLGIAVILCTVIIVIKPDATPFLHLEEMLSPYLEFLKK